MWLLRFDEGGQLSQAGWLSPLGISGTHTRAKVLGMGLGMLRSVAASCASWRLCWSSAAHQYRSQPQLACSSKKCCSVFSWSRRAAQGFFSVYLLGSFATASGSFSKETSVSHQFRKDKKVTSTTLRNPFRAHWGKMLLWEWQGSDSSFSVTEEMLGGLVLRF